MAFCYKSLNGLRCYLLFFRTDYRQLHWLYLPGLMGEAGLPIPVLACSLWGEVQSRTQAPLARHALPIFTFPALTSAFPGLFLGVLRWRSFLDPSAEGSLWREEGGSLGNTFPHSDSVLGPFPHIGRPPKSLSDSRVYKKIWDFYLGLCEEWDHPTSVMSHMRLSQCIILWGKWNRRSWYFLWL